MFGDLMGNMQAHQEEMQKQLKQVEVKLVRDGVTITGNAARDIHDIVIDDELLNSERKEELQDILINVITLFNESADAEQASRTQGLLDNILPGGMGGLGGMFGQ